MTPREILAKIKAVFAEETPAATTDTTATPTSKTYKLSDGTEIVINQAGDVPAIGDSVVVAGATATAGELTLEDNSILVVDATGVITEIKPPDPVTTNMPEDVMQTAATPPMQTQMDSNKELTNEELAALTAKFATGTPEERIANLEVMCKAMMEYCFGWKIREAQQKAVENQAIEIYRNDLTTAQTAVATAQATMAKHEETIKGMFELVEKLVELPSADPKTLTGNKKEQFDRSKKKEEKLEGIASAIAAFKKK